MNDSNSLPPDDFSDVPLAMGDIKPKISAEDRVGIRYMRRVLSNVYNVVLDGTVVKPPYTGVQNSVQHEIVAELKALKWKITAVLALTDSPLRDLSSDYRCLYFETRFATGESSSDSAVQRTPFKARSSAAISCWTEFCTPV